jgi:DnaB-helicase binding domain of primase.
VKRFGAEEYTARLEKSAGYFLWLADRARRKFDMRTSEGRMEGFKFLKPAIAHISDRLERASVANEVAEYLGVERGLILDEFRKSSRREPAAPAQRPHGIPKPERILLRSLVSSPEVRESLSETLSRSKVARGFATWPMLEVILELQRENPSWRFSDLEARLGEQDRNLLNSAILADNSEETFTLGQAEAYAGVLAAEEVQARIAELRNRLKDAERSGDMQEAFRLMEEMNGLQRK